MEAEMEAEPLEGSISQVATAARQAQLWLQLWGWMSFHVSEQPHGRAEGTSREELIHNLSLSLVDWSIHSWGQYAPFIAHCVTQDPP